MRTSFAAALFAIGAASANAANVEGWDVVAYPSVEAAEGCRMAATFEDGTLFMLRVSNQYEWGIGVANPKWNLKPGARTTVDVRVDGQSITRGMATSFSDQISYLPLEGGHVYRALQRGHGLHLKTSVGELRFSLAGTQKAMTRVLDCVKLMNEGRPAPRPQQSADFRMLPAAEATVILTNVLNAASLSGYQLLPPKQGFDGAAFRLSDGTEGLFIASEGSGTAQADDYASQFIGQLSKLCDGEFLSGKQPVASTDGSVVRKVVATCREAKGSQITEATIIRRSNGFLMNFAHFYPEGIETASTSGPTTRTQTGDLLDAALRLDR